MCSNFQMSPVSKLATLHRLLPSPSSIALLHSLPKDYRSSGFLRQWRTETLRFRHPRSQRASRDDPADCPARLSRLTRRPARGTSPVSCQDTGHSWPWTCVLQATTFLNLRPEILCGATLTRVVSPVPIRPGYKVQPTLDLRHAGNDLPNLQLEIPRAATLGLSKHE
jgi:hypothetical protein